jgi:iron complex transport system ATP-binding protein
MHSDNHTPLLACRDLTVGYEGKAVLSGLNLVFKAGEFVSLLGPNGAGKTTLLRTLSRHLAPIAGEIAVAGLALTALSATELARVMAVVLTDKVAPPLFSVAEFVALGRYPYTDFLGRLGADDRRVVDRSLAAVNAHHLARRTFTDLSDGERQKALVARALAQQPRILLLDEPTLHLDLKHRVEVMGILRDLCRNAGITVVASLHDVDVAAKVSDRVALVKAGGLAAWGTPETVLTGESVADLYEFHQAGASFSNQLGSIELRGDGRRGRAFVVAGMGSGAQVLRLLAKRGFAISTGVLHTNDLDFHVARSLGAECLSQPPMETVGADTLAAARTSLDGCDLVIDCGFEVGGLNQGNLTLLESAAQSGKPIYSLRGTRLETLLEAPIEIAPTRCGDAVGLLDALEPVFPPSPATTKEGAP